MPSLFKRIMPSLMALGFVFSGTPAALAADMVPPTVGGVTPTTASMSAGVIFSATYSDAGVGVDYCQLVLDGVTVLGNMTIGASRNSGTATLETSLSTSGSHTLQAQCKDLDNNWGYGAVTTITVPVPGVVGAVTPVTATNSSAVSLSASYSGFNAPYTVSGCWLVVDGSTVSSEMSLSGGAGSSNGTATKSYTFTTNGAHSVNVSCLETGGTYRAGAVTTVTVSSAPADTTGPVVGSVSPLTATAGAAVTISASYTDSGSGVSSCTLYVNSASQGAMTLSGSGASGTASKSYTFASAGTHNVSVQCVDASFNVGNSTVASVVVSAPGVDTTPPSVGMIGQASASVNASIILSATYSDNVGVTQCELYVNGVLQGSMSLSGGTATRAHTFGSAGTYNAYALCRDAASNSASGAVRSISVSTSMPGLPPFGSLMKLVCPAGAGVNHACKAVYYYGSDNRRHAFPNEKVYFTWYANFSGVVEVSDTAMASVLLGSNVNYRPGIRMVKFTTVNKVYAVGRGGLLRWVTTQGIAQALYGSNWNQQIDDISDAFYSNYSFGGDITSTSQYSPSGEAAAVMTVDQNL